MTVPSRSAKFAVIATAFLALIACQSSNPSPPPGPAPHANFLTGTATPDSIVDTDPAAMRLQDIGGYLLLYFREHKQMPATLEDLRTIPGGNDLNFTSPTSGQLFAYFQTGMWAGDKGDKCIVAYDPTQAPGGRRWCLFMMPPKGDAALSVDVVALPEQMFRSYRPAQ